MTFRGQAWLGGACALALSACVAGTGPGAGPDAGARGSAAPAGAFSAVSVERDIEAPQVFNLSGKGLWDGRPSLGGVWVAHSSVTDPERVIIRNPKNGKSVVGALFRREREMPGPGLQVSSDAAEALGLLAGQPADLSVVALRREEKPVPADATIGAEDDAAADVVAADAAAAGTTGGTAAPTTAGTAVPATAGTAAPAAAGSLAPEPAAAGAPAPEMAPKQKKAGGLFGFLRKRPGGADATAAPVAPGAGAGAIEQTTLDPVAASAAAAIDRAGAGAATAKPAAPVPTPAAASAALKRGYIQIGIFSTEANASRAAGQMQAAGMAATVRPDQSNGKTYWRVIVGPVATVAERDALAGRVKGIGYPDAYPVSN